MGREADNALGPFQLGEAVGEGAHATVFRARHVGSGRPVAIKVLRERNESAIRALEREVQAVASLSHASIVEVYDTGLVPGNIEGLVEGTRWVALEFATHGCLADKPPTNYVSLQHSLLQIIAGLAHAHARDVIHRDLKPANVLRSGRRLKIADFGLAWAVERRRGPRIAGTPGYMAPEQIRGESARIGPWTDLYALGCLAWELATGAPPFHGEQEEIFAQHQTDEAPRFLPVMEVPRDFELWLRRLLAKDLEHRGDSAALVAAHLLALSTETRSPALQPAPSLANAPTWTDSVSFPLSDMVGVEVASPSNHDPWLLPRDDWRLAARTRPAVWLLGASLGLYTLRSAPLVGRFSERDRLWAGLCSAVAQHSPVAMSVHGAPGMGTTQLGHWLTVTVREGGLGAVFHIAAGEPALPASCHAKMLDHSPRGLVVVWLDDPDPHTASAWVEWSRDAANEAQSIFLLLTGGAPIPGARAVTLPAQSDEDVRQLCQLVAGLGPTASRAIAARAGGNPGDAMNLLQALVEQGSLEAGPLGFEITSGLQGLPPTHAQRASQEVAALIAGGGQDIRPVAIAALIDGHAPHRAWRFLCEASGVVADPDPFVPLLDAGLVKWTGRWRFAGTTVIDGVLAQLTAAGLQALTRDMAQGLARNPQWTWLTELRAALLLRAGAPDKALTVAAHTHPSFVTERTLWIARSAVADAKCAADDWRVVWLDMNTLSTAWLAHDGTEALKRGRARLDGLQGKSRNVALPIAAIIARGAGDSKQALAWVDEAVVAENSPRLLHLRSMLLEDLDRLAEAEACARHGLALAQASDDPRDLPSLANDVADWDRVHGRLDDAEAGFRQILTIPDHYLPPTFEGLVRENLSLIYAARGDWNRAFVETRRLALMHIEDNSGRLERITYLTTLALAAAHLHDLTIIEDCVVRLEAEPRWRLVLLSTEGHTQLVRAAMVVNDESLTRRLLDIVRRTGPQLFETAVAKAKHGFFSPSDTVRP